MPTSAVYDIAPLLHEARRLPHLPMTQADAREVETYYELAYLNMAQGSGSGESWGMLCVAINLAMILAEMGIGEDHMTALVLAQDGIYAAKVRGDRTGRWGFTGPALSAVRHALDIHSGQMAVASRAEIEQARITVQQRVINGNVYETIPA